MNHRGTGDTTRAAPSVGLEYETMDFDAAGVRLLDVSMSFDSMCEKEPAVRLLRLGIDLLGRIPGALYAATPSIAPGGGIGRHFRHCIDVHDCFLEGAETGFVDYTRRVRDALVETDRCAARRRMERIVRGIVRLAGASRRGPIRVRPEEGAPGVWLDSSVERELEFVRSHTTHHFGIIALLLRAAGFEPGAEFGVAPSTLRANPSLEVEPPVP